MTATFSQLRDELRTAVRYGGYAPALAERCPGLVDLIAPGSDDLARRALRAEQLVTDAVAALDPPTDTAMRIMLGLEPRTRRATLDYRRSRAAKAVGVQPGTWRRPNWELALTTELAFEVYRLTSWIG